MRVSPTPPNEGVEEPGALLDTTDELLTAMQLGDPRVGQALYARFADRLYDLAHAYTHDHDTALAIVADVMVEACQVCINVNNVSLDVWMYSTLRDHLATWIGTRIAPDDRVIDLPKPLDVGDAQTRGDLLLTALGGANERDQLMVNLRLRHGVEGEDLAKIMGISDASCALLWETATATLQHQLSALLAVVWLAGHQDHPIAELTPLYVLADQWDGNYTPLIHREAAALVEANPEALNWVHTNLDDPLDAIAGVPIKAAPESLKGIIDERLEIARQLRADPEEVPAPTVDALDDDDSTIPPGAWPGGPIEAPATPRKSKGKKRFSRRIALALAACAGVLFGIGGTLFYQEVAVPTRIPDEAITEVEAAALEEASEALAAASSPGRLTVPSGSLPIESGTTTSMLLANTGGTVLNWSIENAPEWVQATPTSGSLAPGTTADVALTLGKVSDDSDQTGEITIHWDGIKSGHSFVSVQTRAGLPPQVGDIMIAQNPPACNQSLDVSLTVQDGAGVKDVTVIGRTDAGTTYSQVLSQGDQGNLWTGVLGPVIEEGRLMLSVTATDALGNRIEANRGEVTIHPCHPK